MRVTKIIIRDGLTREQVVVKLYHNLMGVGHKQLLNNQELILSNNLVTFSILKTHQLIKKVLQLNHKEVLAQFLAEE
jgi:hypothetical protein